MIRRRVTWNERNEKVAAGPRRGAPLRAEEPETRWGPGAFRGAGVLGGAGVALFVSLLLLVGDPARAASLRNGINLDGAGGFGCGLQMAGVEGSLVSGTLTEGSEGCNIDSTLGSFTVEAGSWVTYGVFGASAGVAYANIDRGRTGDSRSKASASARFVDWITLDAPGRTGEVVDLVFEIALTGGADVFVGDEDLFGSASGAFRIAVDGVDGVERVSAIRAVNSGGSQTTSNTGPGRVAITLGEPFRVEGNGGATAVLDGIDALENASGNASARFGNSGGITSLALFDAQGLPIEDFELSSESGEFALLVPEPRVAPLVALGALGLVRFARREARAGVRDPSVSRRM